MINKNRNTPKNSIFDNVKIYLQSTNVNYKNGIVFTLKIIHQNSDIKN